MTCTCPHCKGGPTDFNWPEVKPQIPGSKGETTLQGQWTFNGEDWKDRYG